MSEIRRVVLFGGQGSPTLFSPQAAATAIEDAQSSSTAAILLSKCHAAFLEEVYSLGSRRKQVFPDQIHTFHSVEKFLAPELAFRDNGIIQGTTICLYQLLSYISSLERRQKSVGSAFQETLETSGICSGLLPAIVVASSRTAEEFIELGVEAFRLAFWIGYRSSLYCQTIPGHHDKELPWLLVVVGLNEGQIIEELKNFNNQSPNPRLHIAAISSEHCISVSGPGQDLLAFKLQCCAPQSANFAHVHAMYHGAEGMQIVVDEVCSDIKSRGISFPRLTDGQKPIRSTVDGTYLALCKRDDISFAVAALRLLLVNCVDWRRTMEKMSASVQDHIDNQPTAIVQILSIGPNTNSLLYGVKNNPYLNPRLQIIEQSPAIKTHKPASSYSSKDIAIVGVGVDFPQGKGMNELWETLSNGLCTVEEIRESRFELAQYYNLDPNKLKSRTMATKYGNFVDDAWAFDPAFFNISPREAKSMDPQQRLLLHTTLAALENAGYAEDSTPSFKKDSFGCYIGVATGDYVDNLKDSIDVYYSTGTLRAFLSGKISYAFNWSGPSMVFDTACSGSAVAIYHACRALQNGDCTAAVAGGVNVITSPDMYLGLSRAHFLSPSGPCKPFDETADGYSRAEGCGVFVLKRLSNAIAENDRIHGIIKGVEVNQCGNAKSITHPHAETQAALFTSLLKKTSIDPQSVSVVEAHGTGTQAGDMAEATSLRSVFGRSRSISNPLIVSSIKGNIGHCEAASGSAGLAKLLLMLRHKSIPIQASLSRLNPRLTALLADTIQIPRETQAWNRSVTQPRRALLNNFGAAGSNVALLLEEFVEPEMQAAAGARRTAYPFILSARSLKALYDLAAQFRRVVLTEGTSAKIEDVCYTATARRQIYDHRLSVTCSSIEELAEKLAVTNKDTCRIAQSPCPVIFVFSGQGSAYYGMAQELMESSPDFRQIVNDCDGYIQSLGFPSVLRLLQSKSGEDPLSSEEDAIIGFQCACVIIEYALAKLFVSWNIVPEVVIGHSLGEYTALAISGAVSLEDVLKLVALRARMMMSKCQRKTSGMLTCRYSATEVEGILSKSNTFSGLSVACSNSPGDSVLAGPLEELEKFEAHCLKAGKKAKNLSVPYGFHSAFMDPIVEPLKQLGKSIKFCEPTIPIGSNALGRITTLQDLGFEYFANHARQPVKFFDLLKDIQLRGMLNNAVLLEIGPHPTTLPMLRNSLVGERCKYMPTLQRDRGPWMSISDSLGQLSLLGTGVGWRKVFNGTEAKLIDLPGHPLATAEYGVRYKEADMLATAKEVAPSGTKTGYTLLPFALPLLSTADCHVFETNLYTLRNHIRGHAVGGVAICPASIYHEMILEAAQTIQQLSKESVYSIRNIIFDSPLLYDASKEQEPIRICLTKGPLPTELYFKVVSYQQDSALETMHCSGIVTQTDVLNIQTKFAREAAMVKRQEGHLFAGQGRSLNAFQTQMIYETIFTRVVIYSGEYHSLQSLHITKSNTEGYGTFQIPPQVHSLESISSPTFTDTLLHAAGFIANISVPSTELCVCRKVESIQLLYADIDFSRTFTVYCSLFDDREATVIANAFALDNNGNVVASVKGMHFKRLRLSSFRAHLDRLVSSSKTERHASPIMPLGRPLSPSLQTTRANPTTFLPTTGMSSPEDTKTKLLKFISELCGISEKAIDSSKDLGTLGIDSLMLLELYSTLKKEFPLQKLDEPALHNCNTLGDIENILLVSLHDTQAIARSEDVSPVNTLYRGENKGGKVRKVLQAVCELDDAHTPSNRTLDSLGIDSLMMIELEHALQKELGSAIRPDRVHSSRTVQDLENLEDSFTPSTEDRTTEATSPAALEDVFNIQPLPLRLQTSDSPSDPLLLIHDGSGLCDVYRRLHDLDRNVFGFYNPSFFNSGSSPSSLVEMAANYASLVSSSSSGPVILGGWSFGGVVAFEMACQLQNAGRRVDGVVLIDSPYPINHQPLPDAIIAYLTGLQQSPSSTAFAADSPAQSRRERVLAQFQTNAAMLGKYKPTTTTTTLPTFKVVMLQSRDSFDSEALCGIQYSWLGEQEDRERAIRAWRKLLGREMPVLKIPGNHFEPFKRENIPEVSRQISAACRMIDEV